MARNWIIATLPAWLLFMPTQSMAQEQLLASYVADIRVPDHFSSDGTELTTFASLLAQDRSNLHDFGIRHEHDEADPIFADPAMRAQITEEVVVWDEAYDPYVENVLSGIGMGGTYLIVEVFGIGDRITRISFEVPG